MASDTSPASLAVLDPVECLIRPGEEAASWQIRRQQIRQGHEPCFRTVARYVCRETDCVYRPQCLRLRADWSA